MIRKYAIKKNLTELEQDLIDDFVLNGAILDSNELVFDDELNHGILVNLSSSYKEANSEETAKFILFAQSRPTLRYITKKLVKEIANFKSRLETQELKTETLEVQLQIVDKLPLEL